MNVDKSGLRFLITMPKGKIFESFFTEKVLEMLSELGEVKQNPFSRQFTVDEIVKFAQDVDVILTGWETPLLSRATLKKIPNLKLIVHTGASVASLVSEDVYETDVTVLSGNNIYAKSVAEGCLCYTLAALRELEHYSGLVRQGKWREDPFYNRGLIGKKIGIVGFGAISKYYLDLIRWFDCEVLIYSSHLTQEEAVKYGGRVAGLDEIFSECDIVSVHSALTEKTKGMITRELLMKLKANALLVNTARGAVLDEEALFELLLQGRFCAALDVFAKEPIDEEHPIRKAKNVLLMPHMGGPTIDMREVVVQELIKDIYRWLNKEELKHEITVQQMKRMTHGG